MKQTMANLGDQKQPANMETHRVYRILLALVSLALPLPEMEAERSRVPAPTAVVPQPAARTAVEAEPRFGPIIQLLLRSEAEGTDYVLDLDAGRLLAPAHEMEINHVSKSGRLTFQQAALAWHAYLRGLGADIGNGRSLSGLRMYLSKLEGLKDDTEWGSISARECARKIDWVCTDSNPLGDHVIMWQTLPVTWIFQAREGGRGVLQVVEPWDQPKEVETRYRLVESAGSAGGVDRAGLAERDAARVYSVNRKVTDFPDKEDLSTPEAAYATLNRLLAGGIVSFPRRFQASSKSKAAPEHPGQRAVSVEEHTKFLGAEILEVHLWDDRSAVVVAQMPKDLDLRWLSCEDGRWLNDGNDPAPDLDGAHARIARGRTVKLAERLVNGRPPVADPEKHLRPFIEFLRAEAADPQQFLLKALEKHQLVILGEVHNRQRYWSFNVGLVRAPTFARHVGVIHLELPSNDQALMDQFLAAPGYDPAPVIDVLRDMHEFGWPDQTTLEFCRAVWEVNQTLPKAHRLRIVLADIARPWKQIHKPEDLDKLRVGRDQFMAEQIARDLREHAQDTRHALFVVGYGHAIKNVSFPGEGPVKSAGWHLCRALGETNVFAVFPHSPVTSDHNDLHGRLALGLFESAFAAQANRPMAFPLDHGPFGESLFDASSVDFTTADSYRAGFDAFLYLGPLENEIVSPLIPGFYTDEYAREIDRRCRLMNGDGLENIPEIGEVSGAAVQRCRERWWGQPRYEWRRLGPLNAWHYGSGWKKRSREDKYREIRNNPSVIRSEAERLLEALRQADYTKDQNWRIFPSPDVGLYWVKTDRLARTKWVCQHFRTNPIVNIELGEVSLGPDGRPEIPYKLLLKDRTTLEGVLPFEWRPESGKWEGDEGLDWHLRR